MQSMQGPWLASGMGGGYMKGAMGNIMLKYGLAEGSGNFAVILFTGRTDGM